MRIAVDPLENRTLLSSVVVNSIADSDSVGAVTLRDAISIANSSASPTTITFDPTVFAAAQTIVLNGTQLELTNTNEPTTITGTAAGVTIDGDDASRVFLVDADVTVTLQRINVADGNSANYAFDGSGFAQAGGGIENIGSLTMQNGSITENVSGFGGGGIQNCGTLTMENVAISSNEADGHGGGLENYGAISGDAVATLTAVTLSGNSSENDGGGGIASDVNGHSGSTTLVLNNVTVADNTSSADAGGVLLDSSNTGNTFVGVTIAGNSADGDGGGLNDAAGAAVGNTIIAGNTASGTGPDVYGAVTSEGNNLIGVVDGSSGWISTDLTGTGSSPLDADLGSLADNGGSTETLLPASGSPAIGHGSVSLIPPGITTDQRGNPRTLNGAVDIGAVEVQGSTGVLNSSTTLTASSSSITTGGSVTFTATVAGASPTGTVTFLDNGNAIGSGSLVSGAATLTTTSLPSGSDSIIASYGGDGTYAGSVSAATTVNVSQSGGTLAAVTATLTTSAQTLFVGQSFTFSAAVAAASGPVPTGTVTFYEGNAARDTYTLQSDGTVTAVLHVTQAGPSTESFVYSGDANYASATSNIVAQTYLTPSAVVPTIAKTVVPVANVPGQPFNAKVPLVFTDDGSGDLSGAFLLTLYADTSSVGLSASPVKLAQVTHKANLKPGKSFSVTLLAKVLPADLSAGTYYLVAEVTDPAKNANTATFANPVTVTAPFVSLAGSLSTVKSGVVTLNKTGSVSISVTNNGNIAAVGALVLRLGLSTDGVSAVPGVTLANLPVHLNLKPGKIGKYTLRFKVTSALTAGDFYPFVTLIFGGESSTAVGADPFSVA